MRGFAFKVYREKWWPSWELNSELLIPRLESELQDYSPYVYRSYSEAEKRYGTKYNSTDLHQQGTDLLWEEDKTSEYDYPLEIYLIS